MLVLVRCFFRPLINDGFPLQGGLITLMFSASEIRLSCSPLWALCWCRRSLLISVRGLTLTLILVIFPLFKLATWFYSVLLVHFSSYWMSSQQVRRPGFWQFPVRSLESAGIVLNYTT